MTREEYINTLELDNAELKKENKELKSQLAGTTFCYDEEEHRKLKKQLEEINNFIKKSGFVNIEQVMLNYCGLLTQQKEFIKYLQKEINSYTSHIEAIDSVCSSIYSSDYDNSKVKLAIYKEILQKYKEIVNGSKRI